MSRTRKPCPGCGDVSPYRAASDVCSKCRENLDVVLPALLERVEKQEGDRKPFVHHTTGHWNPRFYGKYEFLWPGTHAVQDKLGDSFNDLVEVVGHRPVAGSSWKVPRLLDISQLQTHTQYEMGYGPAPERVILIYPEQRIAFQRMFAAIEEALASTFAQGKVEGQEVIQQMLTGELSMKEMNEMVVTGKSE